ncbi:MAG: hypothetical protein E7672_00520 [Ruminococcaceae bacterium]|nr:hypothetical protein [Oscillospiraceae bacterium]
MLNLIIGRSGTGKSRKICEMIKEDIGKKRQVVLIVPEQETVDWETRMAGELHVSSNLYLEVTNFTRLANSVGRVFGGLCDTVIDEGSRSLLVWRAMLSVWESLEIYKNNLLGDREDRNIPHLMRAIDELKGSGISPLEAENALRLLTAEAEENGQNDGGTADALTRRSEGDLISRLNDAILVYSAYEAILHEDYIDRGDLLINLANQLKTCRYFEGKKVYIDSFFSLTKPEMTILSQMISQSEGVTVTFMCPPTADGAVNEDEIQFGEVRDYLRRVRSLAARIGVEENIIPMQENRRHEGCDDLRLLEKEIFAYSEVSGTGSDGEDSSDSVSIISCADRYDEAEACAAIIDRLVHEGYKYSDIAVVARDISTREGIIDTVIRRHGVRCFMAKANDVSRTPAVRFVMAVMSVIADGWQREDIISLVKTGLTPLGKSGDDWEEDILERYTTTWNISGRRMYTADAWSMNPDGYKTEITERGAEIIRIANEAKEKLIPPLERLAESFDDGKISARAIAEGIVSLAGDYEIYVGLEEIARSYESLGIPMQADQTRRSWGYVCEILDKMVNMLGDTLMDAGGFLNLFTRVASLMDTGTIPTGIDEVTLGSASGVRVGEAKCVIVLGSVEGEFPAAVSDEKNYFGERDKIALEAVGLELSSPDSDILNAREYFMYYRTVAMPTEKLFVIVQGGENMSEGARRIDEIFSSCGKNVVRKFGELPLGEIVYTKAGARYLLSRRKSEEDRALLRRIIGVDEVEKSGLRVTDAALDFEGEIPRSMRLSQSRIETFVSCPFNYTCKYLARIEPEPKAEIRSVDVGNFVHSILEKFFVSIPSDRLKSADLTREETAAIVDGLIDEYLEALANSSGRANEFSRGSGNARFAYLYDQLNKNVLSFVDAIVEEFRESKFEPAGYEVSVGLPGSAVSAIELESDDGIRVILGGVVDRIDKYTAEDGTVYFRIVDYKTGSKTFSLDDLKLGYGVQLMIYLFSIWKFGSAALGEGCVVPAGAEYYITKPAVSTRENEGSIELDGDESVRKIEKSGIFTENEEILRAMERDLGGRFVPVKVGKNGEIKPSDKHSVILDAARYSEIYADLERTIGKIASEIARGRADAKPRKHGGRLPCEWCENKYICRNKITIN